MDWMKITTSSVGYGGVYIQLMTNASTYWTIDRENNTYLYRGRCGSENLGGRPGYNYFLLNFKGIRLFPVVRYSEIFPRDMEKNHL